MPEGRVIVVGSMNLDYLARVAQLPGPGTTLLASGYRTAPGGKGLNQAVAAARAGAPTVMVSAVGDDGPGRELAGVLDAEGIDGSRVRVVAGAPTGVALITVAAGGENTIVVAPGANALVDPAQLVGFRWRAGDVVLAQLEIPLATVEAAMGEGRRAGATTLLNPAPATGPLPPSLLELVDVLIPNEGEAVALVGGAGGGGGGAGGAAGARLAEQTGGAVIVTLGEAGSVRWRTGAAAVEVAAHPVRAVDATGAGDTFCGVLAACLAGGAEVEDAMRRASVAASLSTTREGAVPSIPTATEVDAALGR